MTIVQCLHTAILVADLERAQTFYEGILGLTPVERVLKFPGVWYQIGDYQIHLMVHPEFRATLHQPEKWGRNAHLALSVEDLEILQGRLAAENYAFQLSASGRAALFVQDPDGNIIELNQA